MSPRRDHHDVPCSPQWGQHRTLDTWPHAQPANLNWIPRKHQTNHSEGYQTNQRERRQTNQRERHQTNQREGQSVCGLEKCHKEKRLGAANRGGEGTPKYRVWHGLPLLKTSPRQPVNRENSLQLSEDSCINVNFLVLIIKLQLEVCPCF